jgi:hypothetical protein
MTSDKKLSSSKNTSSSSKCNNKGHQIEKSHHQKTHDHIYQRYIMILVKR